ncbi:zinc-dependent alcohol dehydrogenase family protein [Sphingomonas sp. UYP23]
MNAIQLSSPSLDGLARIVIADPEEPARGQALVRMRAASLNFLDVAVADGKYPASFPLIPVADGAGEVVAIGDDVTGIAIGDRVAVHPKAQWIAGQGTAENARAMRGVNAPGSLIEVATVDAGTLVKAPDHLTASEIATLPIAATTAWNALESVAAGPGSTVVLLGTGGVSVFALQLAKARGARVIITSSSDEKLELMRALGADETVNYRSHPQWDERVRSMTDGLGADLVVETAGSATFERSVAAAKHGGTVFAIGFVSGGSVALNLIPLIARAIRIQGNNTGSVADLRRVVAAIAAAELRPVVAETFSVSDLRLAYIRQKEGVTGKIAITLDW